MSKKPFDKRDQRALKYWREVGYEQMAIASVSECFHYIDILLKTCDSAELVEEINTKLFRN